MVKLYTAALIGTVMLLTNSSVAAVQLSQTERAKAISKLHLSLDHLLKIKNKGKNGAKGPEDE